MDNKDLLSQKLSSIIILLSNINCKLKNIEETLEQISPKLPVKETHYTPVLILDQEDFD